MATATADSLDTRQAHWDAMLTQAQHSNHYQPLFNCLNRESFRRGHFVLASGKTSNYYMDGRLSTLSAEGSYHTGQILTQLLAPLGIQAVGGMTLGADPIVSAVTTMSYQAFLQTGQPPIEGFLIRKEAKGHGTQRQIEGQIKPGYRVVLVEDVITTGGTLIKAVDAVQRDYPEVTIVGMLSLVDRSAGEAKTLLRPLNLPFGALYPIDAFLQECV